VRAGSDIHDSCIWLKTIPSQDNHLTDLIL
jgi:hypothetical protein